MRSQWLVVVVYMVILVAVGALGEFVYGRGGTAIVSMIATGLMLRPRYQRLLAGLLLAAGALLEVGVGDWELGFGGLSAAGIGALGSALGESTGWRKHADPPWAKSDT